MDFASNSLPPVGLMGLFQIKSSGETPRPDNRLQFTFDASQFFARATEQFISTGVSTDPGAQGLGTVLFTVPAAKGWLVTGANYTVTTTALQYYRGILMAQFTTLLNQALTNELVSDLSPGALAINNGIATSPPAFTPILLAPGTNIRPYNIRIIAGPVASNASVRYVEFPWS